MDSHEERWHAIGVQKPLKSLRQADYWWGMKCAAVRGNRAMGKTQSPTGDGNGPEADSHQH